MRPPRRRSSGRTRAGSALLLAAIGLTGCASGTPVAAPPATVSDDDRPSATDDDEPIAPPSADDRDEATADPTTSASATPESPSARPAPDRPTTVRIPSIDVEADVIDLGLNPDRTLEVPTDFDQTGWWTGRSVPGEPGPSIVVGHVDSRAGPAVFHRLRELESGDEVEVDRSDGSIARFRITESITVDKDEFPTDRVYGQVEEAALRLITCGGVFDGDARSYESNVVVFAELVSTTVPPPTTATG